MSWFNSLAQHQLTQQTNFFKRKKVFSGASRTELGKQGPNGCQSQCNGRVGPTEPGSGIGKRISKTFQEQRTFRSAQTLIKLICNILWRHFINLIDFFPPGNWKNLHFSLDRKVILSLGLSSFKGLFFRSTSKLIWLEYTIWLPWLTQGTEQDGSFSCNSQLVCFTWPWNQRVSYSLSSLAASYAQICSKPRD